MTEEILPIKINLNIKKENKLDEGSLATFGNMTKSILGYIFGTRAEQAAYRFMTHGAVPVIGVNEELKDDQGAPRIKISGTPGQVSAFTEALSNEKDYMLAYMEHGLNDPKTLSTRHSLNRAVEEFEKQTGIRWPFTS